MYNFAKEFRSFVVATLLTGIILLFLAIPVSAATFTINNINDSGTGSLRQAIIDSNSNSESDTINFSVTGTIALTSGELAINSDLTITGPGVDQLTISGNNNSRVFNIDSGVVVTISGLTIADGNTSGDGGGIYNEGEMTIQNCTISNNVTTGNGNGGGIYNDDEILTLTNCTINNNTADGYGGGIMQYDDTVTLYNCTISGNTSNDHGGGIYVCESSSRAFLNHCTVTLNHAVRGGGLYNEPGDDNVFIKNTIIANNSCGVNSSLPDLYNDVQSYGYNLIGIPDGIDDIENSGTDITGAIGNPLDPLLGPLMDNGGPTFTHALLTGSPAIDAGWCTDIDGVSVTVDQRGADRPYGSSCDIGAFEYGATPPTAIPTLNEWGLIILSLLMAISAFIAIQRRQQS